MPADTGTATSTNQKKGDGLGKCSRCRILSYHASRYAASSQVGRDPDQLQAPDPSQKLMHQHQCRCHREAPAAVLQRFCKLAPSNLKPSFESRLASHDLRETQVARGCGRISPLLAPGAMDEFRSA